MTIEQKAALYDKVVEERDAFAYLLGEFIHSLESMKFNGLNRHFKDKEGKAIETFSMTAKELGKLWSMTRDDLGYYIADLYRVIDRVNMKFEQVDRKGPAEIAALLPNIADLKEAYKTAHEFDENPSEENIEKIKKTDEEIAYDLVTFFYEYQFGKVYPGDENSIYSDVFRSIMMAALIKIGVVPLRDNITKWLAEMREKQAAKLKKEAKK